MDRIYLEVESQSRCAYGGLLAISVGGRTLSFRLDTVAARALQVDGEIRVELTRDDPATQAALAMLKRLATLDGIAFEECGT